MSEIKVNSVVNSTGDNDSGLDLSTNDQVIIKTANTTAVTVDSSQGVTVAGAFTSRGIDDNADATAMTIDSSENVMIGTSSHDGNGMKLQVEHSSSATDGRVQAHGFSCRDNYGSVSNLGNGIASVASNTLAFATNSTERMRIDSSGRALFFCTSEPSASVSGACFTNNQGELRFGVSGTGNSTRVRFYNPNGEVGAIRTNGSATSYETSSDHRLKENVTADWNATTRLKQLNPVRFNFIADADTTVDGFLAHEVQSVVPEAITGTHNEVDDDGNPIYQGIDQSKLVPLLVKTIQELEARITALENAE